MTRQGAGVIVTLVTRLGGRAVVFEPLRAANDRLGAKGEQEVFHRRP